MTGGQIAALVFAIILLLPGGCFLVFGVGFASDTSEFTGLAVLLLAIAAAILGVAGLLFRLAFRRREPPRTS
jgi:hypothetical protein